MVGERGDVPASSLTHDHAVDLLLDAFPNTRVIAADGYGEQARAFRYAANRRDAKHPRCSPANEFEL